MIWRNLVCPKPYCMGQSSLKPINTEQVGSLIILCTYFAASRHCRLYPNTKCSSTSCTWRTITLQCTRTVFTRCVTHLWTHDALCLGNRTGRSWGICCRTVSCCCSGMDKILRNFHTFKIHIVTACFLLHWTLLCTIVLLEISGFFVGGASKRKEGSFFSGCASRKTYCEMAKYMFISRFCMCIQLIFNLLVLQVSCVCKTIRLNM